MHDFDNRVTNAFINQLVSNVCLKEHLIELSANKSLKSILVEDQNIMLACNTEGV